MIVIDASAMVEASVGREPAAELLDVLAGELEAPHLLDVEVMSGLRGLELGRKLAPGAVESARQDHFAFNITQHEVRHFADRIWHLRHQFTSYDACYLALAEALASIFHEVDGDTWL